MKNQRKNKMQFFVLFFLRPLRYNIWNRFSKTSPREGASDRRHHDMSEQQKEQPKVSLFREKNLEAMESPKR